MSDEIYAGFYQGLAWTQGAKGGPIECGIPDQLWMIEPEEGDWFFDFDLVKFFEIVAEADAEGGIHYWEIVGDKLVLHCTEDSVPDEGPWQETALTAHGWLAIYFLDNYDGAPDGDIEGMREGLIAE